MKRDCEYYASEFVEGLLEQDRAIDQLRERAYVRKQEKRYSRSVEKLLETKEGVETLTELLSHESPKVALTAAVYLLDTSAEMKAVETLRRYANRPEDNLDTYAARERLKDWEKQKAQRGTPMGFGSLSDQDMSLLREAITRRRPKLLPLLDQLGTVPLTDEQRENLREAIGIEFCETGLREDSEPNERGLALESLIDALGYL